MISAIAGALQLDIDTALQIIGASLRQLSVLLNKSLLGRSEAGHFYVVPGMVRRQRCFQGHRSGDKRLSACQYTSNVFKDPQVQRHPQTPYTYQKEAARWLVDLVQASSHNEVVTVIAGAEIEAIDEVIDSVLNVQVDPSDPRS